MLVSEVQLANASIPIFVIPFGNIIEDIILQFAKASRRIFPPVIVTLLRDWGT